MIQRTIEVVFTLLADDGCAAFIEAARKNDEAAQAHAWTTRGLFGKVECEYSHILFLSLTTPCPTLHGLAMPAVQ
jgi:hypothetical protein